MKTLWILFFSSGFGMTEELPIMCFIIPNPPQIPRFFHMWSRDVSQALGVFALPLYIFGFGARSTLGWWREGDRALAFNATQQLSMEETYLALSLIFLPDAEALG